MPADSTSTTVDRPRRVRVSLIGGLRVEFDGEPLRFGGRKAYALLAFLAMRPGASATRSKLSDMLWPDQERARNSLRQILLVLRRVLSLRNADLLQTSEDAVALRSELVDCDILELERAIRDDTLASLDAAARLYSGPFLDGFRSVSPTFDEWVVAEREKVNDLAVIIFDRLARRTAGEESLRYARQLLAIDPSREASYRLVMEIYAGLGDRDLALRTFEACRAALRRELDIEPSLETKAVREAILASGVRHPSPASSMVIDGRATPSAQRPSLVIQFSCLTKNEVAEHLARALSHDLVTTLSQYKECVVYEDAPGRGLGSTAASAPDPPSGGRRFSVNGSVQWYAGQLRVSVHLIETIKGEVVWAQRFDSRSDNLIAFQDDVTQSVAWAIRLELQLVGYGIHDRNPPGSADVRRLVNQAQIHYYRMTRDSLGLAVLFASQALQLDPSSARAARTLSVATSVSVAFGGIRMTDDVVRQALDLASMAVKSSPDDEVSRIALSYALLCADRREDAIAELHHAINLNPNYTSAHGDLGDIHALEGRVDEALRCAAESIRLSRDDPTVFWRNHTIVVARFAAGDDAGALEVVRNVVRSKPDFLRAAIYWAAAAAAAGNDAEASRAVDHCLAAAPDLTVTTIFPGLALRYGQPHHQARFVEMLRKAGFRA